MATQPESYSNGCIEHIHAQEESKNDWRVIQPITAEGGGISGDIDKSVMATWEKL